MITNICLNNISPDREVLIKEDDFAYFLASEELKSVISNFTLTFPSESMISDAYTIMPHGSVTFVLFKYHDEIYSFLFGPSTKPQKVGDLANQCEVIFIIEFQPAGFYPFTKINQKELIDRIIPLSVIDTTLDNKIRNIFTNALTIDELLNTIEEMLLLRMHYIYPEELAIAIKTIIQTEGNISSMGISNTVFFSSRHVNRLFNQYLGMNIKAFTRLVRINKALRLLNDKANTLTDICNTLGYYDTSHFIKDFKIVCHITPLQYRTNMSDFYNEIAKF